MSRPRPGTLDPNRSRIPSSGWIRIARRFGSGATAAARKSRCGTALNWMGVSGARFGGGFPGAEVERDAGPAPVVDLEARGQEGLGLGQRIHLDFLPVALDGLRANPTRAVLPAPDIALDVRAGRLGGR